jgi:hypothetical protein
MRHKKLLQIELKSERSELGKEKPSRTGRCAVRLRKLVAKNTFISATRSTYVEQAPRG